MHVFSTPGGIQAAAPRNICRKQKKQKVQSTETLHSKNSRQLAKFADKNPPYPLTLECAGMNAGTIQGLQRTVLIYSSWLLTIRKG